MKLRVLDDIVQTVGTIHRLCGIISRQDPDLSKQMKRAVTSVALNSGEGLSARGGNRTVPRGVRSKYFPWLGFC